MDYATRTFGPQALNGSAAARLVESGNSIYVHQIIIANADSSAVTVTPTTADGATEKATYRVAANDTHDDEGHWICEGGLLFPLGASTTIVTVRYRPTG